MLPAVRLSCHSPDSELAWPSSRRWGQTGRGPQGPLAAAFSSGDPNAACPLCVRTETCVVRPLGPTSRPPALRLSADRAFPTRASSAGPCHGPSRSETLDAPGAAARGSIANTAHKTAEHAALSRARAAPAGRVGPGAARRGPHVRRGLRMRFDGEANSQPRPAREQLPEPRPARPLTDAALCPHSPGPPTWGSRPPRHLLPAHAMIATSSPG